MPGGRLRSRVPSRDYAAPHRSLGDAWLGIGLLPALACDEPEGVRFARVTPPRHRHVWALVRRGAARRTALAATLDALVRRSAA